MSDNPFAAPATAESPIRLSSDGQYSYRSSKGLLTAVKIGIAIYVLAAIAAIVINTIGTLSYPNFNEFEAELTDQNEQFLLLGTAGSAIVNGLGLLVAGIGTCMFMNRSNKNARALGATDMEFTPGWTVGVWFIPIINLFRPYYAMKEIQMASTNPTEDQWKNSEPSGLLSPWWASWLIGRMIERFIDRFELRFGDLGIGGLIGRWIAVLMLVAAGVLLLQILKEIFESQTSASKKLQN